MKKIFWFLFLLIYTPLSFCEEESQVNFELNPLVRETFFNPEDSFKSTVDELNEEIPVSNSEEESGEEDVQSPDDFPSSPTDEPPEKDKEIRQDTETTVENTIEQEYKFKHEMLKIYNDKYEKDSSDVDNILKLAKIYLDIGQRADAKAYYMQLYNTYPNNPKIQFEMGKFYYQCKQYNAALEFFKLSLSSGYLRNIELNEYTQKTYAKLGDEKNEELYSQILEHLRGN